MRPSHYKRFVNGARIGFIEDKNRMTYLKEIPPLVKAGYEECIDDALHEEQAAHFLPLYLKTR